MMAFIWLFFWFSACYGATHWLVTEDGKLQATDETLNTGMNLDSFFNLEQPHDAVQFMRQEDRSKSAELAQVDIDIHKKVISTHERKDDPEIEEKMMESDVDCIEAGVPLVQQDLFVSGVVSLSHYAYDEATFIGKPETPNSKTVLVPICQHFFKLPFSMHAFEHLQGVQDKSNLSMAPERNLLSLLSNGWNNHEYFGQFISIALKQNPSSWVLHNLATYYWRMEGNAFQAIECVRRALHLTPRREQPIALLSLAQILHHSSRPNDAAVVCDTLIEHENLPPTSFCAMGRVYAAALQYNKSVNALKTCIEFTTDELAVTHLAAVKCHEKLEHTLEEQHENLQQTLSELQSYQTRLKKYQGLHELIKRSSVKSEAKVLMNLAYDYNVYGPIEHSKCVWKDDGDGKAIHCSVSDWKKYMIARENKHQLMYSYKPHNHQQAKISQVEVDREKAYMQSLEYNRGLKMDKPSVSRAYPILNLAIFTPDDIQFFNEEWPSREECKAQRPQMPTWKSAPNVFVSPQNKGFEVDVLLSKHINLGVGEEHPLPWYPPFCTVMDPQDSIHLQCCDHLLGVQRARKRPRDSLVSEPQIMEAFLNLTNPPSENVAELGQRISTLLNLEIGPKWLVLNLAALYWRVMGVASEAVSCLRQSLNIASKEYNDIALVQLAQLSVVAGERVDDAISLVKQSIKIDNTEPLPRFLLFFYQLMKGNQKTARATLKLALELEPRLPNAMPWMKALRCYMNFPHHYQSTVTTPKTALSKCLHNSMTSKYFCIRLRAFPRCYFEQLHVLTYEKGEYMAIKYRKTIDMHSDSKLPHEIMLHDEIESLHQSCATATYTIPYCVNLSKYGQLMIIIGEVGTSIFSTISDMPPVNQIHPRQSPATPPVGEIDDELDKIVEINKRQPSTRHTKYAKATEAELSQALKNTKIPVGPEEDIPEVTLDYDNQVGKQLTESSMARAPPSKRTVQYLDESLVQGTQEDPLQLVSKVRESSVEFEGKYSADTQSIHAKVKEKMDPEDVQKEDDQNIAYEPVLEPLEDSPLPELLPRPFDYQIRGGSHLVPTLPSTLVECDHWIKRVKLDQATSTWLSVTAKGLKLDDFMDMKAKPPTNIVEPICPETQMNTMWTMDHLVGSHMRHQLHRYKPEKGLTDAFQNLGTKKDTLQTMATRLALAINKRKLPPNSMYQEGDVHWTLTTVAALYWRVKGNASMALTCLRHSINNAPYQMRDLALVSMANVYHQSGLLHSALIVGGAALQISPRFVVIHFTMANVYAAMGMLDEAMVFYYSTLALQNNFDPARERINAIYCTTGRIPHPADKKFPD